MHVGWKVHHSIGHAASHLLGFRFRLLEICQPLSSKGFLLPCEEGIIRFQFLQSRSCVVMYSTVLYCAAVEMHGQQARAHTKS